MRHGEHLSASQRAALWLLSRGPLLRFHSGYTAPTAPLVHPRVIDSLVRLGLALVTCRRPHHPIATITEAGRAALDRRHKPAALEADRQLAPQ